MFIIFIKKYILTIYFIWSYLIVLNMYINIKYKNIINIIEVQV